MLSYLFAFGSSLSNDERSFLTYMRRINEFFVGEEYAFRLGIYMANKRYVEEFNREGSHKFKVGLNNIAHLTPSEYRVISQGVPSHYGTPPNASKYEPKKGDLPDEFDWRDKGVLTPIKTQGSCGACWAFSAVCAMEAKWAIQRYDLIPLSEQALIDCVVYNSGCDSGWPYLAYQYAMDVQDGYFAKESDYPYTGAKGECMYNASSHAESHIVWYYILNIGREDQLQIGVNEGVLSVVIDGSLSSFQLYESGIYDDSACDELNIGHSMDIVGYGTEGSVPYWVLRNSWGTGWGEEGYMRILRGVDLCGITMMCVLPRLQY